MTSPAVYNEKRRIVFSTFHQHGIDEALKYLDGYRRVLGAAGYSGLRAELEFYSKFRKEYCLTVAGDMGDHADFAGHMGRVPVRFDVTTSLNYKKLKTYEKFICDGFDYRIALYDQSNWEIIDVLELAFPRCQSCGDSFLFPLALLHPMNYNRREEPLWHSDQDIIDFCPACGETREKQNLYNTNIFSSSDLYSNYDDDDSEEVSRRVNDELGYSIKLINKETGLNIMGLAEEGVRQESKYHDEEHGIFFPYLNGVVARQFPNFLVRW